ncbi:MAG: small conductance mechanosensitive channel [Saprospiraceae bacterium]|jgi:small conductance mechanosensitive channel
MEFDLGKISDMLIAYAPKVVGAIITLIIGFWLAGTITRIARRAMQKRGMDDTIIPFICSIINVGIKVLVLLSVAGMFGIETTSFVAIFGAMAFAIGMALQGSLGHFASGVMLLTFRPYAVGDLVDLGGHTGFVEEIQIFNTILLTPDNKRLIIPNGVVTSGVITNISGQSEIRVDMTFGIGYNDDIDKARSIMQGVIKTCPQVLQDKVADILVSELADSSVNFTVRPWAKSEHYWDVFFYLNENIKKAFDKEGVSIPFPQMDVHQHKVN